MSNSPVTLTTSTPATSSVDTMLRSRLSDRSVSREDMGHQDLHPRGEGDARQPARPFVAVGIYQGSGPAETPGFTIGRGDRPTVVVWLHWGPRSTEGHAAGFQRPRKLYSARERTGSPSSGLRWCLGAPTTPGASGVDWSPSRSRTGCASFGRSVSP